MIKKIAVSIIILITVLLIGCTQTTPPFLEYQSKKFEADATLEINSEKYSVNITKNDNDNFILTFTAPDTISGVCIEKNKDGLFFSTGNVHIPLKDGSNITAETLNLFSLSKNELISTQPEMLNGVKVNIAEFSCPFGSVKLYISTETSLPVLIKANINGNDVVMSFSKFEVFDTTETNK